ncbi:MAG: spore cortex-lytic enzyme [Clostridia bacterium]|nr:spore cortex-lytic enzyme [Clostridia bacterium]
MKKRRLIFSTILMLVSFLIISFGTYSYLGGQDIVAVATQSETTQIQQRLKELGYFNHEVTGYYGNITREAMKRFQYDYGLPQTGEPDKTTLEYLGLSSASSQNSSDLYLLAKCVYAEARGESYVGKVAVASVILNRVDHPDFPNTIAGVVYQPWAFTAVYDGQIKLEPNEDCYSAAQDALNGWDPTYGSIYYYNPATATSQWIFSRETVVTIGNHVFAR